MVILRVILNNISQHYLSHSTDFVWPTGLTVTPLYSALLATWCQHLSWFQHNCTKRGGSAEQFRALPAHVGMGPTARGRQWQCSEHQSRPGLLLLSLHSTWEAGLERWKALPSMVSVMQAREILCSIINDDVLLILLALTGLSPYSVHPVETWPAEEPLWWDAVRVWHFQDGWFPPCRLIGQLPMAAGTCSQAALRSPQAVHSATAQAPSLSSRQGWAS